MRVRCKYVDTFYYENESITVGKEYEVLHENGRSYCIVDDHGKQEYHFKVRFEIIKEDKMEEIKIVRKLEDLDGLENGLGLRIVATDVSDCEDCKDIVVSAYRENWRVCEIKGPAEIKLKNLKAMGFKIEYKPLRSLEEVIAEMRTKEIQFTFNGDNWYVKHVASYNKYYVSYDCHDNIIGTIYLDKETAAKYCIELNEILKGGK